jgi:hypothetical protein
MRAQLPTVSHRGTRYLSPSPLAWILVLGKGDGRIETCGLRKTKMSRPSSSLSLWHSLRAKPSAQISPALPDRRSGQGAGQTVLVLPEVAPVKPSFASESSATLNAFPCPRLWPLTPFLTNVDRYADVGGNIGRRSDLLVTRGVTTWVLQAQEWQSSAVLNTRPRLVRAGLRPARVCCRPRSSDPRLGRP